MKKDKKNTEGLILNLNNKKKKQFYHFLIYEKMNHKMFDIESM